MATITVMDRKSAESVYRATNARYDARMQHIDRSIVQVHQSTVETIEYMNRESSRAIVPFVVIHYFDTLQVDQSMQYARCMHAWSQLRYAWCMHTIAVLAYYNNSMVDLENSIANQVESLAQLHVDRDTLLPESMNRTVDHARVYIPVSNTVLSRKCRSFVVTLQVDHDAYRIAIRTHDSQVKVYSSARMHNAACMAIKLIDKLIDLKYSVASGECTAMVIDKITGECTTRVMVDHACTATLDQIRKLARIESQNVLPFERVKRVFYTFENGSVQRSTMPTIKSDTDHLIMVRKLMHGKHVQSSEYAFSESVMIENGIALENVSYYQFEIPRSTIRTRTDSHGELTSFEVETIDRVNMYTPGHTLQVDRLIDLIRDSRSTIATIV
jgi:hypothetical protein